jgi:hypothetical protein
MMNARPHGRTNGGVHSRGITATGKNCDSLVHAQLEHVPACQNRCPCGLLKKERDPHFLGDLSLENRFRMSTYGWPHI